MMRDVLLDIKKKIRLLFFLYLVRMHSHLSYLVYLYIYFFLAAGFLAAGFLAAGFLTAGFLTAGFLAAGFLAAGFLAAGFLAAGFLAAGFLAAPPIADTIVYMLYENAVYGQLLYLIIYFLYYKNNIVLIRIKTHII